MSQYVQVLRLITLNCLTIFTGKKALATAIEDNTQRERHHGSTCWTVAAGTHAHAAAAKTQNKQT